MNRDLEKPYWLFLELVDALLQDVLITFPEYRNEIAKDRRTIYARVGSEGITFLTLALARIGDAFLQGIDTGVFPKVLGFSGRLPKLFGWALRCFDTNGQLMYAPDVVTVRSILQLCYAFKKARMPLKESVRAAAIDSFLSRNIAVPSKDDNLAALYLSKVFSDFDLSLIRPRHGSGSVAEARVNKLDLFHLNFQSESVFPIKTWGFGGDSLLYNQSNLRPRLSYVSRITFVPKDSKGPRTIAMEPAQAQYLQQALMRYMYKRLGRVGTDLHDQTRMHKLASDYRYVTMDLSNASDSISLSGVEKLFRHCPQLLTCLLATRSRSTVIDGVEHQLNMYATMGNATTFPVMTAILLAIGRGRGHEVHVYGDDIIVHKDDYVDYSRALQRHNFQVNPRKSFVGRVRESCGVYLYQGIDVTPTYIRAFGSSGADLWSYHETANQLVASWFYQTAETLFRYIEQSVGKIPYTGSASLGFMSRRNPRDKAWLPVTKSWCSRLHGYRFRGWVPHIREVHHTYGDDHLLYANWLATAAAAPYWRRAEVVGLKRRLITVT